MKSYISILAVFEAGCLLIGMIAVWDGKYHDCTGVLSDADAELVPHGHYYSPFQQTSHVTGSWVEMTTLHPIGRVASCQYVVQQCRFEAFFIQPSYGRLR